MYVQVSEAYIDYAQKGDVLFSAQREIALQGQNYLDTEVLGICLSKIIFKGLFSGKC